MINGLDPIIIFHIYNKPPVSVFGMTNEFDKRLADIQSLIGIPIAIPLNERLTGILIENESKSITTAINIVPNTDKDDLNGQTKAPDVYQTSIESTVNISMKALEGSVMLTVFLAVADLILSKLVTEEYGITYFHKSTVIFNGLLSSLNTSVEAGSDLMKIDLSISTAKQKTPTLPKAQPPGPPVIPKVETVPLTGGA